MGIHVYASALDARARSGVTHEPYVTGEWSGPLSD